MGKTVQESGNELCSTKLVSLMMMICFGTFSSSTHGLEESVPFDSTLKPGSGRVAVVGRDV